MAEKVFKYKVVVEAVDRPLKSMQETLEQVKKSLLNTNTAILNVRNSVEKLTNTFKLFEGAKMAIGGLSTAFSALGGVIGKVYDVGKDFMSNVLDKIMFRQRAIFSLGRAYGNGPEALNRIIQIAGETTMDTEPMVAMASQLAPSVKRFEDLQKLMLLVGDVQAKTGTNELNDQMVTTLIKTTSGALPEFGSDAVQKLGGSTAYKRELGKLLGMKDLTNITTVESTIQDAKKAGKLSSNILTNAYINMVKNFLGEGKIGELTTQLSKTSLIGAVSNLKSAFDDILISTDWDKVPGMASFRNFLTSVTEEIKSPEFKEAIGKMMESIFGGFNNITKDNIHKFFVDTVIPAILRVKEAIEGVWGLVTSLLGKGGAGAGIKKIISSMADIFWMIGVMIGRGIKEAVADITGETQTKLKKMQAMSELEADKERQDEEDKRRSDQEEELRKRANRLIIEPYLDKSPIAPMRDDYTPFSMTQNIVINGNANPEAVKKAAQEGAEAAHSKARAERDRRKSGK